MRLTRATAVTLSSVLLLAAGAGTVIVTRDAPPPAVEASAARPVELTVHEVRDPFTSSRDLARPPDGFRWIAVDVELRNPGPGPLRVSSLLDLTVRDAGGVTYSPLATGDDLPAVDGPVPPLTSTRGVVVFELPASAEGTRLVFTSPSGHGASTRL